ncbi:collagen-binding protein [Persicobacter psychrovividus]|uniref:Collagen-binding protein n=2 Tax=Persicobacter psychrovividus TaxID=387638 RepID=A0ABN6L680_9BACT|nr:collagen-binding protein [Persicobacter psychrovividus]
MRTLYLLLFFLLTHVSMAQSVKVQGQVFGLQNQEALEGAYLLFTAVDEPSVSIQTVVGAAGSYMAQLPQAGRYKVQCQFLGYQPYQMVVKVEGADQVTLPLIQLEATTKVLDTLEIRASVLQVEVKQDTTVFIADGFKTRPEAMAEDLIRKLPSVEVDLSGNVTAEGEEVKKVLVDGRPFFGSDPKIAMRNLPVEIIEKIEVIDEQSEQSRFTGFDDGDRTKVLNIITKKAKQYGKFGRVELGYGADQRYAATGNLNLFKGDQRISLIGMSNNVNEQNFSMQDLMGVVGGGGRRRGGRGGDGGSSPFDQSQNFLSNQNAGISTTNALGLNYSDKWGEKWTVTGSYFFNQKSTDQFSETFRTYPIEGAEDQQMNADEGHHQSNLNHRFNAQLEYKIDDRNSLLIKPSLSIQGNNSTDDWRQTTLLEEDTLNYSDNAQSATRSGVNFSNSVLYRHQFEKERRTFSVEANTSVYHQDGIVDNWAITRSLREEMVQIDTTDQQTNAVTKNYALGLNTSYTEPVGTYAMLQLGYKFGYDVRQADTRVYAQHQFSEQERELLDQQSSVFNNANASHAPYLRYQWRKDELSFSAGGSYQLMMMDSENTFPQNGLYQYQFQQFLPEANLSYRFSRAKRLRVSYRASTSLPSVTALQDVIDLSDPLNISMGNPALQQENNHTLRFNYRSFDPRAGKFMFLNASAGLTNDKVTNATYIVQRDSTLSNGVEVSKGTTIQQSVNLNGYLTANMQFVIGFPVEVIKSNLNLHSNYSFTREVGMTNQRVAYTNNNRFGQTVKLSSNIGEDTDFSMSWKTNLYLINSDFNPDQNNDYFQHSLQLMARQTFLKRCFVSAETNFVKYDGLSEIDPTVFLMNLSLGMRMMKDNRAELSVKVFDLFNQNQSIARNVTSAYVEDVYTQVLQRYGMVSFTYRLSNFDPSGGRKPPKGLSPELMHQMRP